jgi:hypothetical protein
VEKTDADIDADIASLRESAARYRKLAEDREAHDNLTIAERVLEFVD